jgi:hypothetical protein
LLKLTEKQLDDIVHHLGVARARYLDHAETVCVPAVAETFRQQAAECEQLATLISNREDDSEGADPCLT